MTNPSQGILPWPSVEQYVNRAANGGLTCWYTGAANQTVHGTASYSINNVFARPVVLPGGIIDTVAFEVTTLAAGVSRCGIYTNTSENLLYPSNLLVDGGEQDVSTTGVKSTAALSIAVSPGLYWLVYTCGTNAATIRTLPVGAQNHIGGIPTTMGANLYGVVTLSRAYAALPSVFTAGGTISSLAGPLVAVHYSA